MTLYKKYKNRNYYYHFFARVFFMAVFLLCVSGSATNVEAADQKFEITPSLTSFNTVQGVFGNLLEALQGIVVTLAIVAIVFGGIVYVTSGGESKRVTIAKGAFTSAALGLAIVVAAPTFLKEIAIILNWGEDAVAVCGTDEVCKAAFGAPLTVSAIILSVLNFLLGIFGIVSVLAFIIGGYLYLTAGGREDQIDKGKKTVKYAVLGVVIALSALVFVRWVALFFV